MPRAIYRRKTIKAGATIEVEETYPTRFGDLLTRKKAKGVGTTVAMENYNDELAIRKLTRLINANFIPDDYFITLHYENHNRPECYDDASETLSRFMRKLRSLYVEAKTEFKYIKCTAFGKRGGVHHHVILPQGIDTREITKLWKEHIKASMKARPPEYRSLYSTGEYSSLAAYFVEQKQYTGNSEKYVRKWVASRNLLKPEEKTEDIEGIKWQEPPAAPRGYYVDTDSIRAGTNPVNGRPYLFYRLIKVQEGFYCYDDNGRKLVGAEAVKYYRRNNQRYIKKHWFDISLEGEVVFKNEIMRN